MRCVDRAEVGDEARRQLSVPMADEPELLERRGSRAERVVARGPRNDDLMLVDHDQWMMSSSCIATRVRVRISCTGRTISRSPHNEERVLKPIVSARLVM